MKKFFSRKLLIKENFFHIIRVCLESAFINYWPNNDIKFFLQKKRKIFKEVRKGLQKKGR